MPFSDELTCLNSLGCHLQLIGSVGGCFEWPTGAAAFDALLVRGHGRGTYSGTHFTGTLVSISDFGEPETCRSFLKTKAELEKRDFKLVLVQEGAHPRASGEHKMYLYFRPEPPVKKEKNAG